MVETSKRAECPFCRESIHPEAIKCPHCLSDLGTSYDTAVDPPDLEWFGGPEGNGQVIAMWEDSTVLRVPGPGGTWMCWREKVCDREGWKILGPNLQRQWGCVASHWELRCKIE